MRTSSHWARLSSVLLWSLLLFGCCFSKEYTETGTGQEVVVNSDQPPTPAQNEAACKKAKADAGGTALTDCTKVGGANCQTVSFDPCTYTTATDGGSVTAKVTGHFKCCD